MDSTREITAVYREACVAKFRIEVARPNFMDLFGASCPLAFYYDDEDGLVACYGHVFFMFETFSDDPCLLSGTELENIPNVLNDWRGWYGGTEIGICSHSGPGSLYSHDVFYLNDGWNRSSVEYNLTRTQLINGIRAMMQNQSQQYSIYFNNCAHYAINVARAAGVPFCALPNRYLGDIGEYIAECNWLGNFSASERNCLLESLSQTQLTPIYPGILADMIDQANEWNQNNPGECPCLCEGIYK